MAELIHCYLPETKDIKIDEVKVIFIFDGLDECRHWISSTIQDLQT